MDPRNTKLIETTRELILEGFEPRFGELGRDFADNPLWSRMRELGTELWLDTGDIEAIDGLWGQELSAVTTNNTLLNREVQKDTYDKLVPEAAQRLRQRCSLEGRELVREISFILNAYHALRLVEKFDAFVSVELHTDLACDLEATVAYAHRYHAICPERFIVKIPLTPVGIIATRRVSDAGIPVNLTLGFSARQNFLVGAIAQPAFCNVFLGRLNQVIGDNSLGGGDGVGEKASAASQLALNELKKCTGTKTRQIGASLRGGRQIFDLAGMDVLTMPPKAASEFLSLGFKPTELGSLDDKDFSPGFKEGVDAAAWGIDKLWDISQGTRDTILSIAKGDISGLTPQGLVGQLTDAGCGDMLPGLGEFGTEEAARAGKIPNLDVWKERLGSGEVGIDSLLTLHGIVSFSADQKAMDDRIGGIIE